MKIARTLLYLFCTLGAAPGASAAKALSVQFTISGTNGFDGVDTASLNLRRGHLTGTVQVISPGPATYPCMVTAGSTLVRDKLDLTCTIGPDEAVTLLGTLNRHTVIGKGAFSETFFKEQGAYKASSAD